MTERRFMTLTREELETAVRAYLLTLGHVVIPQHTWDVESVFKWECEEADNPSEATKVLGCTVEVSAPDIAGFSPSEPNPLVCDTLNNQPIQTGPVVVDPDDIPF